ncbi:MAG: ATP-binding protein [Syntrophobacterales bacterium]|nr:ATP-binding protein [Syntrophobacterales bacterium]
MEKVKAPHRELESIKPFKLVKYLSVVGLCVLLVGAFVFSSFIAMGAKKIVLRKSEENAALLAKNLNYRVVKDFILEVLATEGEIKLSMPAQYRKLDQIVKSTIHGFPVERVNIYDLLETLTYSTSYDDTLGIRKKIGEPFKQALKGEVVSVFDGGRSFLGFEWPWGDRKRTLTTYIPMWVGMIELESHREIVGTVAVFEIIQDVSADYEKIFGFQWIVIGSVTLFVGILLFALLFFAKRAEKIIEKRAVERLKLRERLQRAEHLATLGEMIASVSHEIKNPLGIIHSTASLMRNRLEGDKNQRLARIIVDEATRLNNIVTEFLDFARPKDPQFVSISIEDLLDESVSFIESQSRERGIEVEKRYRNGLSRSVIINGDPMLLHRVFYNLFVNALQAMPKGGRLTVDVETTESFCSVKVSDTGTGIPENLKDKIFRPFFTTKEKGTGLGLAIVKSIVETHEGEVLVESEENKGTTIIVKIPFVKKASEQLRQAHRPAP